MNSFKAAYDLAAPLDTTLSPQQCLEELSNKITLALDICAPFKVIKRKPAIKLGNKWFTPELGTLKCKFRVLERRWRKTGLALDKQACRDCHFIYKKAILRAKSAYITVRITKASNTSQELFRVSNEFLKAPSLSSSVQPSQLVCDRIAEFFSDKIEKIRNNMTAKANCGGTTLAPLPIGNDFVTWGNTTSPSFSFRIPTVQEVAMATSQVKPSGSLVEAWPSTLFSSCSSVIAPDLSLLISSSFQYSEIPDDLKKAIILPIQKKPSSDYLDLTNLRPISIIVTFAKILEGLATRQLSTFVEENKILHSMQSGFRPNRSTESALLFIRESLLGVGDAGDPAALVLLDLSAAFDTVDHEVLLRRLSSHAGLSKDAEMWFKSFLSGRTQAVKLGPFVSSPLALTCGVPQGSSLSPLLFNLYVLPLAHLISSYGIPFHMYADDTQVFFNLRGGPGCLLTSFSNCFRSISGWMAQNFLCLNQKKTEIVWIGQPPPDVLSILWPSEICSPPIPVQSGKNLGIIFDSNLNFQEQISATTKRAVFKIRTLRRILPLFSLEERKQLITALVLSIIDYGIGMYLGLPQKTIQPLQLALHFAARSVLGLRKSAHITPALKMLGWMPIRERIHHRVLCHVFKTLKGGAPDYFSELCSRYVPPRSLRSQDRTLCDVPRFRLQSRGGRKVGILGASLWNQLPAELQETVSFQSFKFKLKSHLLSQAYP